jgi:hypothetical protein
VVAEAHAAPAAAEVAHVVAEAVGATAAVEAAVTAEAATKATLLKVLGGNYLQRARVFLRALAFSIAALSRNSFFDFGLYRLATRYFSRVIPFRKRGEFPMSSGPNSSVSVKGSQALFPEKVCQARSLTVIVALSGEIEHAQL